MREHYTTPDKSRDDGNRLASEAAKVEEDDVSGLSVITPSQSSSTNKSKKTRKRKHKNVQSK